MLRPDIFQMAEKPGLGHGREHGDAVLVALAAADEDLISGEVHVLHAEPAALEHPQACSVEQARHEAGRAIESLEHGADLVAGENDGQPRGTLGAHDAVEPREVHLQHVLVQEQRALSA
jgi:hypothetical protein